MHLPPTSNITSSPPGCWGRGGENMSPLTVAHSWPPTLTSSMKEVTSYTRSWTTSHSDSAVLCFATSSIQYAASCSSSDIFTVDTQGWVLDLCTISRHQNSSPSLRTTAYLQNLESYLYTREEDI